MNPKQLFEFQLFQAMNFWINNNNNKNKYLIFNHKTMNNNNNNQNNLVDCPRTMLNIDDLGGRSGKGCSGNIFMKIKQ